MSCLLIETIVSVIIFLIILFNIDNYINFMNMDIKVYKNFTIYSILQLFVCLEFAMIYLSFEIVDFLIYPIYRIKTFYLQLEYSAIKTTSNKIIVSILRMFMSLLKTPFCTGIGPVCSSVYQFITVIIMFNNNFKVDKTGKITARIIINKDNAN